MLSPSTVSATPHLGTLLPRSTARALASCARLLSGLVMVADTYVAGTAAEGERESLYKREVKRFVELLRR
ncbi:MAG: hypothetical protein QXT28_10645 [Thermofilaceae archaeon]